MEITDSGILRRLQSKVVSKEEFDFDMMGARPLLSLLDYSDLDKLYNIASSIRYSGDIQKKLTAIRDVMHPKGFRKLSQGTNRIVYSCYEDPSIVIKIATDKVGMKDNPREFINQHKLKPFVTKVFEVTPDGVVAEVERVEPITSREEFLSSAGEIYELLNMITSRYIMADIGSHYFMNFGIRKGFGGILLDYPYMYEVDSKKLMCCAPNYNEPSGICGGWIDYDAGFNKLCCTKCGAEYKAIELAKDIQDNKIVTKGRKSKMKVAVNWKNNVKETSLDGQIVSTGDTFKAPKAIVRPAANNTAVGKLKVATPVVTHKEVKEVAVTEEKVEVVEKPQVEEEVKVVEKEPVVDKEETKAPETKKPEKVDKKNGGLKVKVTTQDGKTAETAVEVKKNEESEQKGSSIKVNDKPTRQYKVNHGGNLPRRSQVQPTAITFLKLKELDFKYSSIDLEFHKMFFRADNNDGTTSTVMVDFDSIPKEKLDMLAGNSSEDMEEIKKALESATDELEKAKMDLNTTEEALANLRSINNSTLDEVNRLREENAKLIEALNNAKAELQNTPAPAEEDYDEPGDVEEPEDVEEEYDYEPGEYDNDHLAFIRGSIQTVENVCDMMGFEVPENIPSNAIISFRNSDDENGDFLKDQDGRIICMPWINDYRLDDLKIETKPVIMGEGDNTTEE